MCEACSKNSRKALKGSSKCNDCPNGRAKTAGQTFATNPDDFSCTECLAGFWATAGQADCTECSIGMYQNDQGQSSCKLCAKGLYNDEKKASGIGFCKECPRGTYSAAMSVGKMEDCNKCASGKKNDNVGSNSSVACVDCDANTKAAVAGSFECIECSIGEKADKGSAKCTTCDAGEAGTPCRACVPGQYRPSKNTDGTVMNAATCMQCPAGDTSKEGASSCDGCDVGMYGSKAGTCSLCPAGRYQDGKGETSCKKCEEDTYLTDTGKASKADCRACSSERSTGTVNGATNASVCLCKHTDYYQKDNGECEQCPPGANCSTKNGVHLIELFAKPGYWRNNKNSTQFQSCAEAHYGTDSIQVAHQRCCPTGWCNSTNIITSNQQCFTGYQGPLCMACAKEYVLKGNACEPCKEGSDTVFAMLLFLVVNILVFLATFISVYKTKTHKQEVHEFLKDHFLGQLRILISWAQIISAVTITFNSVSWPSNFKQSSQFVGFVNLDVAVLLPYASCRLSLPFGWKLGMHIATPVAFVLMIKIATFVAVRMVVEKSKKKSTSRNSPTTRSELAEQRALRTDAQQAQGHNIMLTLLLLIYPSLSTTIFTTLRCYSVIDVGFMLERDFSIQCWEAEHMNYVIVAFVFMILFIIGIPSYLLYDLWMHIDHLHNTDSPKYHAIRFRMGSFFKAYEEEYWYFEVVVIFQKMLMAGAMAVIAPRSPLQLLFGFFMCSLYLLVVLRTAPFAHDSLDTLSFLSSLAITFTLLGGLIKRLNLNEDVPGFDEFLGGGLIAINCMPLVYALYDFVRVVMLRRMGRDGGGIKKVIPSDNKRCRDGLSNSTNTKVLPVLGSNNVQAWD